ncbi:MAG: heme-binding domain-containing protein [Thermoleophilia bacterium]|nr:heme-binding domain-containing protein [Thermoleophilia bacterium]
MRRHPVVSALYALVLLFGIAMGIIMGLPLPVVGVTLVVIVAALLATWGRTGAGPGFAIGSLVVSGLVVVGLIQLVPYGRDRTQPPITGEPQWASAETRTLMVRACYHCHASEVEYPAYASIAPSSWAVQSHIAGGRSHVNYQQFATNPGNADETIRVIRDGSMPPAYFTRFGLNPEAALTDEERATLIAGLEKTPGMSGGD